MEKAKVALIQFCLSPPKTDMENQEKHAPSTLPPFLSLFLSEGEEEEEGAGRCAW